MKEAREKNKEKREEQERIRAEGSMVWIRKKTNKREERS